MAFRNFPEREPGVVLLQRSLERGRLAHAYLFTGNDLAHLETLARTLAKTLNCQKPVRGADGAAVDCCDACPCCGKIDNDAHADAHWVRPESKSRVILIDQMRDLIHEVNLKPLEADYKVGMIVDADRLNVQAGNAFLKTLEEPPPKSVLFLLTTDPQRVLETIKSRCLRLNFGSEGGRVLSAERLEWVSRFGSAAAAEQKSLLGRYRLLGALAGKLAEIKAEVEANQKAKSPLARYEDVEPELQEQWEEELEAAIEAAYRHCRAGLLTSLQLLFRDAWLLAQGMKEDLLHFPQLSSTQQLVQHITAREAMENLQILEQMQWLLATNVQESLALEVGLLKLHL
jgi:DNA polymerase-3 subunit delta'